MVIDRRGGERTAVEDGQARLLVPSRRQHGRSKRIRVQVSNFSANGLGFYTHRGTNLRNGLVVWVEIRGASIPVQVLWSSDIAQRDLTYYGATILDSNPTVLARIEELGHPQE